MSEDVEQRIESLTAEVATLRAALESVTQWWIGTKGISQYPRPDLELRQVHVTREVLGLAHDEAPDREAEG